MADDTPAPPAAPQSRRDPGRIRVERDGPVARIVFDRPAARNAMTWTMYEQLAGACERLGGDPEVRVVVLRGAGGRAFVAGTDIAQFSDFTSGDDGIAYERRIASVVERLERLPQPTVAVVDGYAVGGGLLLASVCDLRICSPAARFGIPVARTLGNCLAATTYSRLAWLLGPAQVKKLVLCADFLDAEEAARIGLASEVVEEARLEARVTELTHQLAAQAPLTMWATKESLRRLMSANVPDTSDVIRRVYGSADFAEGVAAFVERRQPRWRGV